MEDILTCQNHEDVAVSHAETLVLLSVGKEMETRASILTEASKWTGVIRGPRKGSCPSCTMQKKNKNIHILYASGLKESWRTA